MNKQEKIQFTTEDGENVSFYVVEQTMLGGVNYLLVTEEEEGDGDAYIMKDTSKDGEEESVYVFVEDDEELNAVATVFESMLEDVNFE